MVKTFKILSAVLAFVATIAFGYGFFHSQIKAAKESLKDMDSEISVLENKLNESINETPEATPQETPVQVTGTVSIEFISADAYLDGDEYYIDLEYDVLNNTNVDVLGVDFTFKIYDSDGYYIDSMDIVIDENNFDGFPIMADRRTGVLRKMSQGYLLSNDFPEQDIFSKIYLSVQEGTQLLFEPTVNRIWY